MPVSSLIVRTGARETSGVARALEGMAAVTSCDVRGADIVIVTETVATAEDEALWQQIERVTGVLAVELIYHNFEDLEETQCP